MENENKPSNADPNSPINRLLGGQEDVSRKENLEQDADPSTKEALELSEINNIVGRDFKSKDEALKHLDTLNKYTGDQTVAELRKKAEDYDRMIAEANKIAAEEKEDFDEEDDSDDDSSGDIASIRNEIQEEKLLRKYPEADKILSTVRSVAKAEGLTLTEAYENHLKDLHQTKLATDKAKAEEENVSVSSRQRISSAKATRISDLAQQVVQRPTEENQEALVREFFGNE